MRLRLAVAGAAAFILGTSGAPRQAWGSPWDGSVRPLQSQAAQSLEDSTLAPPEPTDTTPEAIPSPELRIGLKTLPFPFSVDLMHTLPDPSALRPELVSRVHDWAEVWGEGLQARLLISRASLWIESRPATRPRILPDIPVAALPEEVPGEVPPTEDPAPADAAPADTLVQDQDQLLPDAFSQYADLGIIIQGRVELGGGWTRSRPCNVSIQLSCEPRLIPDLNPDIQFGARVGGTVSERIHVSVDYDNRREFDAANNINLFYQGLEDEIIQRIEVGDVTFPLPQNRFLNEGIPAGNFGFRATGQMGPIDFQGVWATQKGDVGTRELRAGGGGEGFEQDAVTVLDDADYELGRFFFLFDPDHFAAFPDVDIQRLVATDAPANVRPASVVKIYRYEGGTVGLGAQVPEGFITAVATAVDTLTTSAGVDTVVADTLSGLFRPLINGEDYILHQSGTWLLVRLQLPSSQALAVTYIAADGTEIGTFDAEAASDAHSADPDNVPPPSLELAKGVNSRPGAATWAREMHNVYRVSASPGVVLSSIQLTISQGPPEVGNTFRAADGQQLEFLKIFGLDDDPTDNEADLASYYEVGASGGDGTTRPGGTYVVFPTLEPFKRPPPLRNTGALSGQPFPLRPGDVNSAIYDESNDLVRRGSNLYRLTISYRQRFEGFLSTISLGAGGVREASDRVFVDDRELVRGEDYSIDYDIGQIELRDPDRWFRNNPNARLRITFEQKPLFQLAPTSVFGLQARYALGSAGELNFIGLSQNEKTVQTRPELGLEPSAVQLGGVSGRLNFEPAWLTNLVNALPGVEADAPSAVSIDGEVAVSLPTTNTQGGITYVDDFEGGPGFGIAALSRAWRVGSAPSTSAGAEMIAPAVYDASNAAELVWQDQYTVSTPEGIQVVGGLSPGQIDDQLAILGLERAEPVLWISERLPENSQLAPSPVPAVGPAWRSITSVISLNGQDFTTIEFLEFYIGISDALADSVDLIIDLGTVSEDAFALDSLRQPSGVGRLNREVDPPQVWSNSDDVGLWGTGCEAEPGLVLYPLGDVRANCTRNNGLEDTEDLNQNSVLDTEERFFRYTVEPGDPTSPYFVRFANNFAGIRFRLFRIPLRRPDHRERVTDAEFQNIKQMRFTFVTRSDAAFVVARINFLGSSYLKRGAAGVVAGIGDTTSAPAPAAAEVGPISTLDARYESPPGVTDEAATTTDQFALGSTEINEQSLSLAFAELPPDERAEVYLQYVQTPLNFLAYRGMLVWALGIDGPWGLEGSPLRLLVKLGEDTENFYLYKTPLHAVPPGAEGAELQQAWLPQLRIDMNRFIALRTRAEEIFFQDPAVNDSVLQVWDVDVFEDGDSTYAVFISQRSRAPNLAAIRQLSLAVYNGGTSTVAAGELWVNDIRLDRAVDNTGVIGSVNLDVRASDVLGFNFSFSNENPYFRQLAARPSFSSASQYRLGGRLEAGRFLPNSWAVRMPINVRYSNSSSSPVLLPSSDIFTEGLTALRSPASKDLRMDVSLSRQGRSPTPVVGWLVDNSSFRFGYDQRSSQTSRTLTESHAISSGYSYRSGVADVSIPLFKPFFFLPRAIRNSGLRLTPSNIQLGTSYVNSKANTQRFSEIVELPLDTAVVPIATLNERLQTNASVDLAPFTSVTGRFAFAQNRELVPTGILVQGQTARELIESQRTTIAGVDLGWVIARTINANLAFRPNLVTWLPLQLSADTRFRFGRGASFITEIEGDTVLTQDFGNGRNLRASVGMNLPVFLRSIAGSDRGGVLGALLGFFDRIDIFTANWDNSLSSSYDRTPARPDFAYQVGLGGFEDFRVQDGDSARTVTEGEGVTLTSGFRFPLGAGLSVDYRTSDGTAWTPANQTDTRAETWPSVRLNWNRLPMPPFVRAWIETFGIRTGYSVTTTGREIVNANQDRTSETKRLPFAVTLAFTGGWTFSYGLDLTNEERVDATGSTFGDATSHSVQIGGRIKMPVGGQTFTNPLRLSLRLSQTQRAECRQLGTGTLTPELEMGVGGPDCQPFTDLRIRRIDLTADTDLPPFVIGLQGSWRDTQSEIGQRPGSTQLDISLFGQFLLETGEIR